MVNSVKSIFNVDFLLGAAVVGLAGAVWFQLVQNNVPASYLDEVFHVRQAENYLRGKWHIWDPKITTPPGLYLASVLHIKSLQAINVLSQEIASPQIFRSVNVIGSVFLAWIVRRLLLLNREKSSSDEVFGTWQQSGMIHHTVNICLFPPLFFFYPLYYTDVLSALSVLFAYQCYLEGSNGWVAVCAGLVSLLLRQTNIFWVSLFLGGFAFCRAIPHGQTGFKFSSEPSFGEVVRASWYHACSYDPPISQAGFEDYIKCGISYGTAGVAKLPDVLRPLAPYLFILSAFAVFVGWNGGVVLGKRDKENHIPSLHLAQMLYLWPYITFFSFPLLYPYLINLLAHTVLPSFPHLKNPKQQLPRLKTTLPTIATVLTIIHYNTLIHPFTLADNRHYTFYVFRILLRHPSIKYLAAPIYFLCAWAAIAILSDSDIRSEQKSPLSARKREKQANNKSSVSVQDSETKGPRTSFLLLWLLATAASVITAPLVEPRYFIVPWLIWRIEVASALITTAPPPAKENRPENNESGDTQPTERYDYRLWLETAWFLCINVGIGYMFLYRGFEWAQEPGKVQRFMW